MALERSRDGQDDCGAWRDGPSPLLTHQRANLDEHRVRNLWIVVDGDNTFLTESICAGLQSGLECLVVRRDEYAGSKPNTDRDAVLIVVRPSPTVAVALECIREAAKSFPGVPAVLMSVAYARDVALAAIREGARGFVSLDMGARVAAEAVKFVASGGTFVPAECIAATASNPVDIRARPSATDCGMTPREQIVARALRQGKPNKVIAYEIGCSETTVKVHLRNVMRKLGARNRTEAAVRLKEAREDVAASGMDEGGIVTGLDASPAEDEPHFLV